MSKTEKIQSAILKVLSEADAAMGAAKIKASLLAGGVDAEARTIRFHLLQLDRRGLTEPVSRRAGRVITRRGREELSRTDVFRKVGVIASRVDSLAYQMTYRPGKGTGSVVLNVSMIYPEYLNRALNEMKLVFRHNLAISSRLLVTGAGQQIVGRVVPENFTAIGTVCSVTVSGALLHEGVPVKARFGGLLEVRDRLPVRFVELIEYQGSTLDPLEVFIQAGMTRVRDVVLTGTGILCAGFREIPAVALEDVRRIEKTLRAAGLGGIVALGKPNQPLLGVPVSEGHAGMIVYGGLNPIAVLQESGIPVKIKSLAGFADFAELRAVEDYQRKRR